LKEKLAGELGQCRRTIRGKCLPAYIFNQGRSRFHAPGTWKGADGDTITLNAPSWRSSPVDRYFDPGGFSGYMTG
jgi:hypothetical protein